ncbi:MAG: hypothetical protein AAFQ41_06425, partial [Cyanobacteria bacterium J06623_7]
RLRTIMSEVVNKEVSSKIVRLENSIDRMVSQFEGIKNGDYEDAALRVTTDSEASDLALVSVDLPREALYPYSCTTLADKLNIRPYDVQKMIKKFDLRHNSKYQLSINNGRKAQVHKWSEATYKRLKQALDLEEYPRPNLN